LEQKQCLEKVYCVKVIQTVPQTDTGGQA
jgi:hypothetical protein